MDVINDYESAVRLIIFVAVFVIMACAEAWLPRRRRIMDRTSRWLTNGALVIIDTIAVRVFVPVLAVGAANVASTGGWGAFALLGLPYWAEVVLAVIVLDLIIYVQHVVTHKVPMLWALHKVHHADRDFDVTTGVRFHPVEILLSMMLKVACIFALGLPALGVFLFEVLLNATAMFNHANLRLPKAVDRIVRLVLVTPDMHRVHHSVHNSETDSNFGFCLPFWDRLFGTYIDQPKDGHVEMTIGLAQYQDRRPVTLQWSLLAPFQRRVDSGRDHGD